MFKAFLSSILIIATSSQAMALAPITGKHAMDIVTTLEKLSMKPLPGADLNGYTNIKTYSLMGLVCQTGVPVNSGMNPNVEATCSLELVASVKQLNQIRAVLQTGGLNPANTIFKL